MEMMVFGHLEKYLEHHKIYLHAMAGLRHGRSSIDNVMDLVTLVQHNKSLNIFPVASFLNIKGVYNNVIHDAILDGLQDAGVGGWTFRWI